MPEYDIMPFFYGPPAVGAGERDRMLIVGRGSGYLDIGQLTMPVPEVKAVAAEVPTPDQKTADAESVAGMRETQVETITTKDGRTVTGRVLGRTNTYISIAVDGKAQILPVDSIR
jgi:hypothetical protein